MSLNKKKMVREIGRRTRIKNRDVQAVIEALIDVWTEELVGGGRIELENFILLEVRANVQSLHLRQLGQISVRASKALKTRLNGCI